MNTVGWAFMYEVLCTCITAPLEGLLVDKAKYSENVGHHLFLKSKERERKTGIRTTKRTIENRTRIDATTGTHPVTRRSSADAKWTIRLLWKFPTTQLT